MRVFLFTPATCFLRGRGGPFKNKPPQLMGFFRWWSVSGLTGCINFIIMFIVIIQPSGWCFAIFFGGKRSQKTNKNGSCWGPITRKVMCTVYQCTDTQFPLKSGICCCWWCYSWYHGIHYHLSRPFEKNIFGSLFPSIELPQIQGMDEIQKSRWWQRTYCFIFTKRKVNNT